MGKNSSAVRFLFVRFVPDKNSQCQMNRLFINLTVIILTLSCTVESQTHNSVYYWKTTFAPDSTELAFLAEHKIDRIYLHMFDVAIEQNYANGSAEVVPIATTRFSAAVPGNVEIVPVAYITIEALRAMSGKEQMFANLIVDRLQAMCSYNECGKIREMQLDCDWTSGTKDSYSSLCRFVRDSLGKNGILLSVTVRLHQLREIPPPADRGVLMLYNTGALKNPETKNSILDPNVVRPYLKQTNYPIPIDYAYPVFGWGVKFKEGKFVSIVSEYDAVKSGDESIRKERPSYQEIMSVKKIVEEKLGKPSEGNILYHLDSEQLKNYTDYEINQILNY